VEANPPSQRNIRPRSGHERDGNGSRTDRNHHLSAGRGGRRTSFRSSGSRRRRRKRSRNRRRRSSTAFQKPQGGRASSIGPEARERGRMLGGRRSARRPRRRFLARRWPTSGEKGEESLLGCGIYQEAPCGRKQRNRPPFWCRHKCLLFNQLRRTSEWAKGLTTGNQNADSDPPEVPNKLINPTNSDRRSERNPTCARPHNLARHPASTIGP
jgi:hypothetical protein